MKLSLVSSLVLLSRCILAQRPESIPACDYYAQQIFGNNTITSQRLLLTTLMNTVILGTYTSPNNSVKVLGIASPAVYNGTDVNLLPYFTGALNSTDLGGAAGGQKLFLDDGGPVPLQATRPANTTTFLQYHLLTHIYEYFGSLLGCSLQGSTPDYPKYQGRTGMFELHKFMYLDIYQNTFFITQWLLAASSLGFQPSDLTTIHNTLQSLFNYRCSPPSTVPGIDAPAELHSVCIAENCPIDPNGGDCSLYPDNGVVLRPLNVTEFELNQTMTGTASGSTGLPSSTAVVVTGGVAGMVERGVVLSGVVVVAIVIGVVVQRVMV